MNQTEPKYIVPPTPTDKPSWWSTHHLIGYVFLIAVLAAIASGIYYWQIIRSIPVYEPVIHKDQTANWKIYTNTQYGFEFKYPKNWEFTNRPTENSIDFFSIDSTDKLTVRYTGLKPGTELNDVIVNINGQEFLKGFYNDVPGYNYERVHSDGTILTFIPISITEESLKQILSTFKFTSQDTVFCGGTAGIKCPTSGYKCVPEGNYPDAGTNCTKIETTGTLSGHVTIGPFCPVEREDMPCPPPAGAYDNVTIVVNTEDHMTTIKVLKLDSEGNYKVDLPAGKYTVGTGHNEMVLGMGADSSFPVTIIAGETVVQDFEIDTGIR